MRTMIHIAFRHFIVMLGWFLLAFAIAAGSYYCGYRDARRAAFYDKWEALHADGGTEE
jgi:hypothetical protein